jgi:CRP/FNR family transcriptional regulator, nitrogen fixation regulation protein
VPRQITGFYFPGDAFGLESAEKHNVDAQAITNAEVRVIKKQALTALAASNREVANQLLTLTTRELARKQDLLLILSRPADERMRLASCRAGTEGPYAAIVRRCGRTEGVPFS